MYRARNTLSAKNITPEDTMRDAQVQKQQAAIIHV